MIMIKKFTLILTLAWAAFAQAAAPELPDSANARAIFTSAPPAAMPMLSKNVRMDMLDYFDAGVDHASDNKFGGPAQVTAISQHAIDYQTADGIACQLAVLNAGGRPMVCVVTTYPTPIPDSRLQAWDSDWKETQVFNEPRLADWLIDKKNRKTVEAALPFILASYKYNPETQTLTVTNEMAAYWTADERPAALDMVRDRLLYRWDGKRFKLVKP